MMNENQTPVPDNTAVRTALWRALHLTADARPPVFEDEPGLEIAAPEEGWQNRPDMNADFTKRVRASILARARYVEDMIVEEINRGIKQYVILGAGLDTFAQRKPTLASQMEVYEIDEPPTQSWKKQRLTTLGYEIPKWLHFVPVDFEKTSWWDELLKSGFDAHKPAFVSCTGVSLYLTKEAITSTLSQIAQMAKGSRLAMTFYLPLHLMDKEDQPLQEIALKGTSESKTPMISFFSREEIAQLAINAGFKEFKTISTQEMTPLYFAERTDGLVPASGEIFLVATT
ncbi:MAG: class I SAM-dependent methyltransferase [Ginsengibacter sp.]